MANSDTLRDFAPVTDQLERRIRGHTLRTRHFPPEWAEQTAVLIAWPTESGPFADCHEDAARTYARIAYEVSRRETIIVACADDTLRPSVAQQLAALGTDPARVRLVGLDYDDVWVRDTAPLSVETADGPVLLNFRFNGWGGKYPCDHDAAFGATLLDSAIFSGIGKEHCALVLEGGSIDSDGAGTVLTTSHCLNNPNRNPAMAPADIEETLKEHLGVQRILWINHGRIAGDDTDAHVDTLARFCDERTIAFTACDDPTDPHYSSLSAMADELRSFRTLAGDTYRLVPLPIPSAIFDADGTRLPATYANFLIINGAVLLPVYGDPKDELAEERLAQCFPQRAIVPIGCRTLIRQYGSLHCMTMQFPKSVPLGPR